MSNLHLSVSLNYRSGRFTARAPEKINFTTVSPNHNSAACPWFQQAIISINTTGKKATGKRILPGGALQLMHLRSCIAAQTP
jgi:hypothetical protein